MHRAQHSIVRLGSTPVARRGLSPSACFGRSGSKGAVTSTAQRRASTRRHASAVAGGYGRREEGLAGSTGELVCGVDISVSSTNRWSTTSSFQSQPVEATEAASSTETPSATELETAPIPPINGSQATPLSTSLLVDTSAGTSLNSRPRPPQPPPPRHQYQRRHQTPYQRREHTQHLKQLRKEEAGAAAAAARRKSGLLNESSQAPPLLITQIAGRQVPATTREAVAINLEARQKIENPPRQQRQQQAKLKRKQKLQSPQTCHEESPPSPPTPAFRFVTEAHKQQLGRAGGKRGQREQANGGGVSDSVVHADIDLAAAASAGVVGVPAWGMVDGGDAVPRKAAGLTSGCSSGAGVPDAGAGPDVAKAAIRPAWEVVESGDVEAAAGRGRRKPLFFLKPTAPAMTKMPPPRLDFNEQIELFTKKRQLLDVANVWEDIVRDEEQGKEVTLSQRSYRNLMRALVDSSDIMVVRRSKEVYDHMNKRRVEPDTQTYQDYMRACQVTGMGRRAVDVMNRLNSSLTDNKPFRPSSVFMYNLLLAASKEGLVEDVKSFYDLSKTLGIPPNAKVLNSLLQLFTEVNMLSEGLMLMEDIQEAGFRPRDPLVNKLVYACIRKAEPSLVHSVLDLVGRGGNVLLAHTVQNVLYLAARRKDTDLATKIWALAQTWDYEFSDMDYNFTVSTFINSGKDEMALATISQAYKVGRKLSAKTLEQVAEKLSLSNNRLDGAYYTLAALHESGESVPVEAVNTVIAGSAMRLDGPPAPLAV